MNEFEREQLKSRLTDNARALAYAYRSMESLLPGLAAEDYRAMAATVLIQSLPKPAAPRAKGNYSKFPSRKGA
jgi:hypothetical protein